MQRIAPSTFTLHFIDPFAEPDTMTSLQTAFPQTFSLAPAIRGWELPFAWSAPDLGLLEALWASQVRRMNNLSDFWARTEAMVADLSRARALVTTDRERDAIDCARFITCMPAIHATRAAGQMGGCYDWIWSAVAATHVRGERVNTNTYTFLAYPGAPRDLFSLYLQNVPPFAAACFYTAYKFGGLDGLTEKIAAGCWAVVSDFHRRGPQDDEVLEAMMQMVIWAAHRDWPKGGAWAQELLSAADRTRSIWQKLHVVMTFVSLPNRYVDGAPQEWAKRALRDHGVAMVEHERLQCLSVSLEGPDDWKLLRTEILQELAKLRAQYLSALRAGESDLEVLELRVSVIHPLVFSLVNWGDLDSVIDVLGAWYRASAVEPADGDVLAVFPTQNGGAAYLWPGGSWLTGTGSMTTHDAIQHAASAALGSYFRGSDGDYDPQAHEGFRFDVVDAGAGSAFEDAMAAHYRSGELAQHLPAGWKPRAVVIFPSGPEPVQAMLSKVGFPAPLEISFEQARASRPIRRIAIWAGGPWHETFEMDAISHVARRAGWAVDVHQIEKPTLADLRNFYEDRNADVAWVISHGAHDPFAVRGTGLHLRDESLVDLEELRSWTIPSDGRRLLVLNSCSGASAQGRGGLARIGLAQSLVSGFQAVLGHLWPVHWTAGLAFGAALAAALEADPTEAAVLQAAKLLQDPAELMAFLEDRFEGCDDLLDRLRRSSEDLTSMTNWGCPVLLT
ncbi:CHAT domain-containing protein [Rhizobium leguminosarum]|uniref:CHAT domain-containing protein n=1 Tax=Rhizobium ruizarguesonis TaxID=2081791 RepID=UPI0013BB77D3|nr:CHAT domain-containing protein [Rhizobium ruizarguesonis]NEJ17720.1 CHAT domain-containing protein [Rhizobium ruizarguesonis]NEK31698.1 CHAT domain-containing protein [Rhizobium ruizarguesonis]